MTQANAKAFIEKCNEGEELAAGYKALVQRLAKEKADAETVLREAVAYAAQHGYDLSVEDLKAAGQALGKEGELSEEELEAVAGGGVGVYAFVNVNDDDEDVSTGTTGTACAIIGYNW